MYVQHLIAYGMISLDTWVYALRNMESYLTRVCSLHKTCS